MRFTYLTKLVASAALLLLLCVAALADTPAAAAARMLPDEVGEFRARGAARVAESSGLPVSFAPENFGDPAVLARSYSAAGQTFHVQLIQTRSDSAAYALLRHAVNQLAWPESARLSDVGTEGYAAPGRVLFFRGATFVSINPAAQASDNAALLSFARSFAAMLDQGEGEIPPLVKHLPEWQTARHRATYAVTMGALQEAAGNRPALAAVSFDGGTEAVTATYGEARLVIVEYLTPQLAFDQDARITQHLQQLSAAGQTSQPLYRREGNYSVFVFDAPDEQTGRQLLESVRYEQLVRWLGDNPRAWERAQRAYVVMMGSVILNTLLGTGVGLLIALGLGVALGALIFMRRRAHLSPAAFTDNGGMVSLDIAEITRGRDTSRLISSGEQR